MCWSVCPVREMCLMYATEQEVDDGIWGGLPRSVLRNRKFSFDVLVAEPNPYVKWRTAPGARNKFATRNLKVWRGDRLEQDTAEGKETKQEGR